MEFRDFKQNRPTAGTRILAFSPVYPKGDHAHPDERCSIAAGR